jgi:hypothetical protein
MKRKILVLLMFFVFCISSGYEGEIPELKNSTTAVAYSMGTTFLPIIPFWVCLADENYNESLFWGSFVMSFSGIVIGPSTGHFYASNTKRGLMSAGLRTVSTGVFLWSSSGLLGVAHDVNFGNAELYFWVTIVSGITTFGSIVFDIWTCPSSVEKYNRSIRDYKGFYLMPEVDIEEESYGLSLSYRF